MLPKAKWIDFVLVGTKPKTLIWEVRTKEERWHNLGKIQWFAVWRKYAFFPESNLVFESRCLSDISDFLTFATNEHRTKQKAGDR